MDGYSIGIYVRESKDEDGENYETIETQRDLLIDFIKNNKLGEIAGVYIDDNVSGAGFERRGIYNLRRDIEEGQINLLVIKDLSRLGRNNAKTLLFLDYLEEHGVRVITFDGRYDSFKDNDTVGIETWFNERYIRDISKKIRASLRFKIQKGEYIGHAPYGYIKSSKETNKLCIDEEAACVVKEIYKLYKDGYGYAYISKLLNQKGCPSPSKGSWNPVAVQRILTNRVYIGDTVQGVSEKISFKSKKRIRLPKDQWIITQGTHKPIISKREFEEVQRIRESRRVSPGPHKGRLHLFRGILYCGRCGSVMFARKRKNRPIGYICSGYSKNGRSSCTSHFVNEEVIEGVIVEELAGMLKNKDMLKKLKEMFNRTFIVSNKNENKAEKYKKKLALKKKQQDILYMDRLEDKISEDLFLRINNNLEKQISKLKEELKKEKVNGMTKMEFNSIIYNIIRDIQKKGITHKVVNMVVDRITVYDAKDYKTLLNSVKIPEGKEQEIGCKGAIVIDFKLNKV